MIHSPLPWSSPYTFPRHRRLRWSGNSYSVYRSCWAAPCMSVRWCRAVVVWGGLRPEIRYGDDYREIPRVNGTMINEGKLAADFLTKQGYKKFVVVHDTTD